MFANIGSSMGSPAQFESLSSGPHGCRANSRASWTKKQVLCATKMMSIASSPIKSGSLARGARQLWSTSYSPLGQGQVNSSTQLLIEARGEDPSANAQKLMQNLKESGRPDTTKGN